MYIVRFSDHIQEDIKRNWSSLNFGQEGFEGTEEELEQALESITDESPLWISGIDVYDASSVTIKELYSNYWVLVDQNFTDGLACNILEDAETLEEAIQEVSASDFDIEYGEGECVDCSDAKVVYSFDWNGNQTYILEVED